MHYLGIRPENFNPQVYFTFRGRYEENHVTKIHSHDFVTMIYVMSGSCTYTINGISYRVRKGDMLVFNADVTHGKTVGAGEEIMELHVGLGNICIDGLPRNHLVPDAPPNTTCGYEHNSSVAAVIRRTGKQPPGRTHDKGARQRMMVAPATTKTDIHRSAKDCRASILRQIRDCQHTHEIHE